MLAAFVLAPLLAVTIQGYRLPVGFTVKPEAETRQISIARDGTIVALAESTDRSSRFRALRWSAAGDPAVFTPLIVLTGPDKGKAGDVAYPDSVAAGTDIYVTAATNWSGAYSGTSTEVQRWTEHAARWALPACVKSDDEYDQHAYDADPDGRVAITIDMIGMNSFEVMSDTKGEYAPYAYVVRGDSCRSLGRGVVDAVRGQWAAGYRGYLDGHLAPDNLNTIIQTTMAVRWNGEHAVQLGRGDALAINSSGIAVGADAIPGRWDFEEGNFLSKDGSVHTYRSPVPHAVVWDTRGRPLRIAPGAQRSVAYDIADDGTVVGMLVDKAGHHYAFRYRSGALTRLDDLPHSPGWRFESAYAIAADGTIAGTGTLNGTPMVFTLKP
jgi:hypothetical protein